MTDVINEYLEAIIPDNLEASVNKIEFLYENRLGDKMLKYIQDLKLANMRRFKGGGRCKVNITWKPKTTPQNLSCLWDPYILGNLSSSKFSKYLDIYLKNKIKWRIYYDKKGRGLMASRPSYP